MNFDIPSPTSRGLCDYHAKYNWLYHMTRRYYGRPRDALYNYEDSLVDNAVYGGKVALVAQMIYPEIKFCRVSKAPFGGTYFVSECGDSTLLKLESHRVSSTPSNRCSLCELLACVALKNHIPLPLTTAINFWFNSGRQGDHVVLQFRYGVLKEKYPYGLNLTVLGPEGPSSQVSIDRDQIHLEVLRKWPRVCREHHSGCIWESQSTAPGEPRYLPNKNFGFRVIDVAKNQVVPAPAGCEYIALSYVWGNAVPFTLRKADIAFSSDSTPTFENSYVSLDRNSLPQTIQDAMFVVATIGKRYLWVDSLCIVQDDLEDLNHNLHCMDRIYSAAELTIVAAGGEDANAGLQGLYPGSRHLEIVTGTIETISIAEQDTVACDLARTTWGERAWTYQEYQFSDRSLIFTNQRVYYECRSGFACESTPNLNAPRNPKTRYLGLDPIESTHQDYEHYGYRPKPSPTARYERHVEEYSPRQLTHQDDILNAFTAIMEDYTKETGSRFCWGLPLHHFSSAMLWATPQGSRASRESIRRLCSTTQPFPSWSWAGWVGSVDFRVHAHLRQSSWHITFAVVWPWDTEYELEKTTDPFTTGILTIQVSLGVVELDDTSSGHRHFDEGRFHGERIHCFLLGIISGPSNEWNKLEHTHLVMSVEQHSNGNYYRIGLLHLRASTWRRMKPIEQVIQLG
jgi:hypothetical protein